ncbi:MAG: dihydroxy-acid dehydratase [Acidobacteria bacterium]|nr:dihydroxy-acid dehydratase [Acidobacteriota bacterium]
MRLRSHEWLRGRDELGFQHRGALRMLGLDMDRYEGEPVVGIASSWSELNPCDLTLRMTAEAVKTGVRRAGGIPLEFPVMGLGEDLMKPSAMMYRNLLAMQVEETLRACPLDGVVLLGGCDKTIPAQLMAAASADLPAIQLNAGPRPAGAWRGRRLGSGTDLWRLWDEVRSGRLVEEEFHEVEKALAAGPGACNVMGTASTMAAMAETLGVMPPGTGTPPAGSAGRLRDAESSGKRIVAMIAEDLRPSRLLTPDAFDNAIRALLALGGSTNAVLHLLALAGRAGVDLPLRRFDVLSRDIPCLVDLEPVGVGLVDDFESAGGVPALLKNLEPIMATDALTVTGRTWREELATVERPGPGAIRPLRDPVAASPTLAVLEGSLAPNGGVLKVAAATPALLRHEGPALVFDSYADLRARIDDPDLEVTAETVLVLRHAGPRGAPGMPEWGMIPIPKKLQQAGVRDMVRLSDARMSGTGFGTVVLHVAPEAAVGGPLALVRTGDRIALDTPARRLELLVPDEELARRRARWRPPDSPHHRGWPRVYIDTVLQADEGCDLDFLRPRDAAARRFVPPEVGRS